MTRPLSVAHLTAINLAPPEFIRAAARAGFASVGLRLIRVTPESPGYPLMSDPAMMLETKAALFETGIRVNDIEFVKIEPDTQVNELGSFLDAGAELGAKEVICAPYDPDLNRLADTLGALSDAAETRGLDVSLEFFPWTVVPDISTVRDVVARAGPNVGILVDSLHFNRSNSTLDELKALPKHRLRLAHLCDAAVQKHYTTDDLLHTARAERLPPGRGQIPLKEFIAALPADIPLGLEVPMTAKSEAEGDEAVLAEVFTAAAT